MAGASSSQKWAIQVSPACGIAARTRPRLVLEFQKSVLFVDEHRRHSARISL